MTSGYRLRGFSVNGEPFSGDDLSVASSDGYPLMLPEHKRTAAFEAVAPNLDPAMPV